MTAFIVNASNSRRRRPRMMVEQGSSSPGVNIVRQTVHSQTHRRFYGDSVRYRRERMRLRALSGIEIHPLVSNGPGPLFSMPVPFKAPLRENAPSQRTNDIQQAHQPEGNRDDDECNDN